MNDKSFDNVELYTHIVPQRFYQVNCYRMQIWAVCQHIIFIIILKYEVNAWFKHSVLSQDDVYASYQFMLKAKYMTSIYKHARRQSMMSFIASINDVITLPGYMDRFDSLSRQHAVFILRLIRCKSAKKGEDKIKQDPVQSPLRQVELAEFFC